MRTLKTLSLTLTVRPRPARLARAPAACPAAFRSGVRWTLTSDPTRAPTHACRTRSGAAHARRDAWRVADGGRNFLQSAHSIQDAAAQYCAFHDSVTSAAYLQVAPSPPPSASAP